MTLKAIALLLVAVLDVSATSLLKRAACTSYTLIETRGTFEAQGPSKAFVTMNSNIRAALPGGKEYDTVYPADVFQNSTSGTLDIINKIKTTLQTSPNECFILEGYSQGAAATINALNKITGTAYTAVKGVFLVGDPYHFTGLPCNVDNHNGLTTRNVSGVSVGVGSIPQNWISKTLDVCIYGDGVCDTSHGWGINTAHGMYGSDADTQNLGTRFVTEVLNSGFSPVSCGY